jgi:uncharacterized protein (DUF488 family)
VTNTLWTVGHGAHPKDEFVALLAAADVAAVVDVRIGPGSRRHPHFGRDELARWLPDAGVAYRWERRLGGFRKAAPDSPDVALRNESFRGYAGHMRTADFAAALAEVLTAARGPRTAVMCSETVWWRCHRRLIADHAVLLDGWTVQHILPPGRCTAHVPTAGVRAVDGTLVYDDVTAANSAADSAD